MVKPYGRSGKTMRVRPEFEVHRGIVMNLKWFLSRIVFDFLIFFSFNVSLVCFLINIFQGWQSWIQNDRWNILSSVFGLMVMGVFAEIRNGSECFCKCNIFVFQIKLCSILVFGNAGLNILVRINHDNVASRGCVGRTHIIVRLQTWNRRKDQGTEFRGVRICVGWISTTRFCVVGFYVPY